MGGTIIILICILVFVVIFAAKGFKIIPQAETMIVERLGKYNRTLESGINIIWPIIDRARKVHWLYRKVDPGGRDLVYTQLTERIDLREQVYDFPKQNVITKDNVTIQIDAMVYFQIIDPVKSVYEIANLPDAVKKLTQTTLRNVMGELELDQCLTSRDTINHKLRAILDEATDKWGMKVNRVELQDIEPPANVREQMERQMTAERAKRAQILNAEGLKQSQILEAEGIREAEINKAEGDKRSQILRAEGQAQARVCVAEAEAEAVRKITAAIAASHADPAAYLIGVRYIDALKEMVSGKDNKVVYIPYEATGVLGALGGIREIVAQAKPTTAK